MLFRSKSLVRAVKLPDLRAANVHRIPYAVHTERVAKEGGASRERKKHPVGVLRSLEAPPGIEPGIEVLQTFALPLGHGAVLNSITL